MPVSFVTEDAALADLIALLRAMRVELSLQIRKLTSVRNDRRCSAADRVTTCNRQQVALIAEALKESTRLLHVMQRCDASDEVPHGRPMQRVG